MKKRGKEKQQINLLELIPVTNLDYEKQDDGSIVLLKPKFKHPILKKYVLPRLKKPFYRVKLDAVGSFIWEQCDGKTPVKHMAQSLKEEFGEKIEPLYDRLSLFLQHLERNHFIFFKGL